MKKTISKFQIQELLPIGMTLVVLGIALAYGLSVMGDVADDISESDCARLTTNTTSYSADTDLCYEPTNTSHTAAVSGAASEATGDAVEGVAEIPAKLPTIATVVVAAVIIGILVTYLAQRFM